MSFISAERRNNMDSREIRSAYWDDSTSLGSDVCQLDNLTTQKKAGLVMHQVLSDSKKWQDHDEEDILPTIDSMRNGSEFVQRLGPNGSRVAYQWPCDKIDTFQRRPPHMS